MLNVPYGGHEHRMKRGKSVYVAICAYCAEEECKHLWTVSDHDGIPYACRCGKSPPPGFAEHVAAVSDSLRSARSGGQQGPSTTSARE